MYAEYCFRSVWQPVGLENRMKRRKRTRRFNDIMKNSLYLVFIVVILACVYLIGRMVYINNNNGDEYARKVLSQQA